MLTTALIILISLVFLVLNGLILYANIALQRSVFLEIDRLRKLIVKHSKTFSNEENSCTQTCEGDSTNG